MTTVYCWHSHSQPCTPANEQKILEEGLVTLPFASPLRSTQVPCMQSNLYLSPLKHDDFVAPLNNFEMKHCLPQISNNGQQLLDGA